MGRWIVVVASSSLLAIGCASPNPAFDLGEGESEGGATTKTSSAATGVGDDANTSSGSGGRATEGEASSDPSTGAHVDPTGGDTGSSEGDSSDGVPGCDVPDHALFDVSITDSANNAVGLVCGQVSTFTGIVGNMAAPNTLVLLTCPNGACSCASEETPLTFTFTDLEPSPMAVVDFAANGCIALAVGSAEGVGCEREVMWIERAGAKADYPLYFATNGFEASSFFLPDVTLGRPLRSCDDVACQRTKPPGVYPLWFGQLGPISPGDSAIVKLDPYASGADLNYEVHNRFAYVDEACEPHVGWTAVHAGA